MKTEMFGRLTAITLDSGFSCMSDMLKSLGVDELFVAFNTDARNAGVRGLFIAKDPKRTWAFTDDRNPRRFPINRWTHSPWGSATRGSLVDNGCVPQRGDVLVLTETLEKAKELSM